MIVLDTDHISELQYPNSARGARLFDRMSSVANEQIAATIVTVEEQMRGWLATINKHRAGISQVDAYSRYLETVHFFRPWLILPFDKIAAAEFQSLRSQDIRIGTMDLKIAAIVLTRGGKLLSANRRDFRQVPNRLVEDWLAAE
jgi:tRNA(fMet)-specific endonuclease VapC